MKFEEALQEFYKGKIICIKIPGIYPTIHLKPIENRNGVKAYVEAQYGQVLTIPYYERLISMKQLFSSDWEISDWEI